jgi:CheY-like chemotaxis protein
MADDIAAWLIEDNPDDVAFFEHALAGVGLGNQVRIISDAPDALGCLGPGAGAVLALPRVIFLDLKMPLISGLDVLRQLRADARTKTVPIVVFSSSREERDLGEAYHSGANSYVVKPMDFDQFAETVRVLATYWLHFNQTPKSQPEP